MDLQRLRRQVSFDRLLARLFSAPDEPWLLKGGYAMELRLKTARATKDIDLSIFGEVRRKTKILEELQDRAAKDPGDCFVFTIGHGMRLGVDHGRECFGHFCPLG
jgi:hypothetical protein